MLFFYGKLVTMVRATYLEKTFYIKLSKMMRIMLARLKAIVEDPNINLSFIGIAQMLCCDVK